MATKKATTKKASSSRKTVAAKKTNKPAVRTTAAVRAAKPAPVAQLAVAKQESLFPTNLANIILAELLGTFILTMVAMTAFAVSPFMASSAGVLGAWLVDPLFIGLTFAVLVMGLGAISGTHINPAVTFGLWTMRRLKTVMVPVYWASQFLGALLAIGIMNVMTNGNFSLSLASFTQFNLPLFFIELIGAAIFMFGLASVMTRSELSSGAKSFGIGLSLTIALVAGVSMLMLVQKADYKKYTDAAKAASSTQNIKTERPLSVDGPVLNPAVALAVREDSAVSDRLSQTTSDSSAVAPSRFGLEVIIGSLVGAAVGGNLYLLAAYRPKNEL